MYYKPRHRGLIEAIHPWKDAIAAFQGDGKHLITRD